MLTNITGGYKMYYLLQPYQIGLETFAACLCVLAIICAFVGWKVNRNWYKPAFILAFLTAIVWLINTILEFFMGIHVSAIVTVLLVILSVFLANIWYKAAYYYDRNDG